MKKHKMFMKHPRQPMTATKEPSTAEEATGWIDMPTEGCATGAIYPEPEEPAQMTS